MKKTDPLIKILFGGDDSGGKNPGKSRSGCAILFVILIFILLFIIIRYSA